MTLELVPRSVLLLFLMLVSSIILCSSMFYRKLCVAILKRDGTGNKLRAHAVTYTYGEFIPGPLEVDVNFITYCIWL